MVRLRTSAKANYEHAYKRNFYTYLLSPRTYKTHNEMEKRNAEFKNKTLH